MNRKGYLMEILDLNGNQLQYLVNKVINQTYDILFNIEFNLPDLLFNKLERMIKKLNSLDYSESSEIQIRSAQILIILHKEGFISEQISPCETEMANEAHNNSIFNRKRDRMIDRGTRAIYDFIANEVYINSSEPLTLLYDMILEIRQCKNIMKLALIECKLNTSIKQITDKMIAMKEPKAEVKLHNFGLRDEIKPEDFITRYGIGHPFMTK